MTTPARTFRVHRWLIMPAVFAGGLVVGGCGGEGMPPAGQAKPPDKAYLDAVNNPPAPAGAKPGDYPDQRSRRELRADIKAAREKAKTAPP